MRVYAIIHSVEGLDTGYSETSVKFFDHAKGAWDEVNRIEDTLFEWDDRTSDSFDRNFDDTAIAVQRLEWGETRRYIYKDDDSPNQVVTLFCFWRPQGDWTLVYDQVNNKPSVRKTLDMVLEWIPARAQQEYYEDLMNDIRNGEPIIWDGDDKCVHWFPISTVQSDPTLPF